MTLADFYLILFITVITPSLIFFKLWEGNRSWAREEIPRKEIPKKQKLPKMRVLREKKP